MIDFNSPLRLLPPGLDRQETLVLDGIRHAAEIATFAERRLLATLTSIATAEPASPSPDSSERITAAYLDGWAIVDAIDRLCRLSRQLNSSDPAGVGAGLDARLQGVRNIRNVADHLERRLEYVAAHGSPALGRLSWFTLTAEREGLSCLLVPGTVARESRGSMPNPAGKAFRPPTDYVTLSTGEYEVSLSDAIRVAGDIVRAVEDGVRAAVAKEGLEGKQVGADVTIMLRMSFFDPAQGMLPAASAQKSQDAKEPVQGG